MANVTLKDQNGNTVGTFTSIQAAVNAAATGYTLVLSPGEYNENVTVNKDVTITADLRGTAVVNGGFFIAADGVTIDGLTITGEVTGPSASTASGIFVFADMDNFTLTNSSLLGVEGNTGVLTSGGGTGLNINNNTFGGYDQGIYVAGANSAGVIENNLFRGDRGTSTGLGNGVVSETTGVIIRNNTFDGLYSYSIVAATRGPNTVDLNTFVMGNTLVNSGPDQPIAIFASDLSPNFIGTDNNEDFIADWGGVTTSTSFLGNGGDDRAFGSEQADSFNGGAGDDLLDGNGGNDTLLGGDGNDTLQGKAGDDVLHGGIGNDNLDGGADNDTLRGQAGDDTISGGTGADIVEGGQGNDVIDGGDDGDSLQGGEGNDQIQGGLGDDTIFGKGGSDQLFGGDGNDTLRGEQDDDFLSGGAGNDGLFGGQGQDTLNGGTGDDTLTGALGTDTLIGGAGADVFRYQTIAETTVAAPDQILDFLQGTDKIDLTLIDADTNTAGDDAFTYIGSAAFSNTAGELRVYSSGFGSQYVEGDVNGDGMADFRIEVFTPDSPAPLAPTDFNP